jgi:hypothetical protein
MRKKMNDSYIIPFVLPGQPSSYQTTILFVHACTHSCIFCTYIGTYSNKFMYRSFLNNWPTNLTWKPTFLAKHLIYIWLALKQKSHVASIRWNVVKYLDSVESTMNVFQMRGIYGASMAFIPDNVKPDIDRESNPKTYSRGETVYVDVIFTRETCWP